MSSNQIGPFDILRSLGIGNQRVFKAVDPVGGKTVAVRPIKADMQRLPALLDVARRAMALESPNIVQVREVEEAGDESFVVTEYVEGDLLRSLLKPDAPVSIWEAADIVRQICGAIDHAHLRQLAHRNLAPTNIMVEWDGTVKVMDYETVTDPRESFQSGRDPEALHYLSPEQARGEAPDWRSNLFSLGTILYELLTGKRAFEGTDAQAILANVMGKTPLAPHLVRRTVNEGVSRVIMKALAKSPADRYQSGAELIRDFENNSRAPAPQSLRTVTTTPASTIREGVEGGDLRQRISQPLTMRQPEQPPLVVDRTSDLLTDFYQTDVRRDEAPQRSDLVTDPMQLSNPLQWRPQPKTTGAAPATKPARPEAPLRGTPTRATSADGSLINTLIKIGGSSTDTLTKYDNDSSANEVKRQSKAQPSFAAFKQADESTPELRSKPKITPITKLRPVRRVAFFKQYQTPLLYVVAIAVILAASFGLGRGIGDVIRAHLSPPTAITEATPPQQQVVPQQEAVQEAPVAQEQEEAAPTPTPRQDRRFGRHHNVPLPVSAPVAMMGALMIETSPQGATVQLDGQNPLPFQTPFTAAAVSVGRHTVVISKPGYVAESRVVDVIGGMRSHLLITLTEQEGSISVASDPQGAEIFVDGRDSGKTTPATMGLKRGSHTLSLQRAGYLPASTKIDVGTGQSLKFAPHLLAMGNQEEIKPVGRFSRLLGGHHGNMATLQVRSSPKGARIIVNQRVLEKTTPAEFSVPEGSYRIRLALDGYSTVERTVTLAPGSTFAVDETMTK